MVLKQGGLTVIIEPFVSILIEQQKEMKKLNIICESYYGATSRENKKKIIEKIKSKNIDFNVLLTTPETIYSDNTFKCCLIYKWKLNL